MIKFTFCFALSICCVLLNAKAQTDSSHYDLGRISVRKEFTQSITIKGADLERYQFADLVDVINVWLHGTYSNASTLVYVVDGNIINDVNAYSIHDIEEITLIQDALAVVSGANPGQQLVLITTRGKKSGKQGIEVAGKTSLVDLRNHANIPNVKTTNNLYNDFYLSTYKNFSNANFGFSADYQRDVFPKLNNNNYRSINPFHYNRVKLNTYGGAELWKGSTVNFGINYVPQVTNYDYSLGEQLTGETLTEYNNSHATQHLINLNANINSYIIKGLTNTLAAAYNHYNYFERDTIRNGYTLNVPQFVYEQDNLATAYNKSSILLIRDNLAYHARLGVLDIEPALNFSYRSVHDSSGFATSAVTFSSYSVGQGNPPQTSYQAYYTFNKYQTYLLAPSLNMYYKDIFNIQGGFVYNLSAAKYFGTTFPKPLMSPFLTASIDVGKLSEIKGVGLRLFGSFAKQNAYLNDAYSTLAGFSLAGVVNSTTILGASSPTATAYIPTKYNPESEFNNYHAGAVFTLFKNFIINYSFEYRFSGTYQQVVYPTGANGIQGALALVYDKIITNRIGLSYNLYSNNFSWRTGLNMADSKLQLANDYYSINETYLGVGHRASGGFTNRFTYKTFFAGLDVLYQLGERPYSVTNSINYLTGYIAPNHNNSVSLQNLYAGAQIKINHVKYAEAFINGRNILQNNSSDITDNRRFVGLGIKAGI